MELLHEKPAIAPPAHPKALPARPTGRVSFDHVTFHYPTRPDSAALRDFSLTVAPARQWRWWGRRARANRPSSN